MQTRPSLIPLASLCFCSSRLQKVHCLLFNFSPHSISDYGKRNKSMLNYCVLSHPPVGLVEAAMVAAPEAGVSTLSMAKSCLCMATLIAWLSYGVSL